MKNVTAEIGDHEWGSDYTIDVEPTTTTEGSKSIHCTVCDVINADTVTAIPKIVYDIRDCIISLSNTEFVYDGTEKEPTIIVKNGSTELSCGKDYTVSYSNNINVGTATITVTGIGNYTGTLEGNFAITKADQTVTASAKSSSIKVGGTTQITASGQGTITYSSSNTSVATVSSSGVVTGKKPGKVTITVKAAGNSKYNAAKTTVSVTVALSSAKISSLTNTSTGIKIKWSKVSGASGYYIYRKTSSGSYKKINTISGASTVSYTDTAVKSKNGTTYIYKVVPYSGSTKGSGTAKTTVRLTGTSLTSVKNSSSKKIAVKWTKVTKVTGYQIQYSTSKTFASGNSTKTISGATNKSKTLSSLKKGKTYYVRIRTYKTVNGTKYYSAWSSKLKVKITK